MLWIISIKFYLWSFCNAFLQLFDFLFQRFYFLFSWFRLLGVVHRHTFSLVPSQSQSNQGVKTELLLFCSIAVQRQLLQSSNSKPEVNLFAVALFAVLGLLRSQWRKQPGGTFRPGLDASGSPDCSSLQRTNRRGRHEHESPWWRVGLENVDSGSVGFVA